MNAEKLVFLVQCNYNRATGFLQLCTFT